MATTKLIRWVLLLLLIIGFGLEAVVASPAAPGLVDAAKSGDLTRVTTLLRRKVNPNLKDVVGTTALIAASSGNHVDIVNMLLAAHADVNAMDATGMTSLMMASERGYRSVADVLISAKANVNARGPDGFTALTFAASNNQLGVVEALLSSGADTLGSRMASATPLSIAARNGYLEVVQALIAAHANVNLRPGSLLTPLGTAAYKEHKQIVDVLIVAGANVDTAGTNGMTPTMASALIGDREIMHRLLTAQASLNARMADGRTALDLALSSGHTEAADDLKAAGATSEHIAQTPFSEVDCTDTMVKADGMAILFTIGYHSQNADTADSDVFFVFGNVSMEYVLTPAGGHPANKLMPGGPVFLWVIRDVSPLLQDEFKGLPRRPLAGEVYIWATDGKSSFPTEAKRELKYLCNFDPTMTDREIQQAFLKSTAYLPNPPAYILHSQQADGNQKGVIVKILPGKTH